MEVGIIILIVFLGAFFLIASRSGGIMGIFGGEPSEETIRRLQETRQSQSRGSSSGSRVSAQDQLRIEHKYKERARESIANAQKKHDEEMDALRASHAAETAALQQQQVDDLSKIRAAVMSQHPSVGIFARPSAASASGMPYAQPFPSAAPSASAWPPRPAPFGSGWPR